MYFLQEGRTRCLYSFFLLFLAILECYCSSNEQVHDLLILAHLIYAHFFLDINAQSLLLLYLAPNLILTIHCFLELHRSGIPSPPSSFWLVSSTSLVSSNSLISIIHHHNHLHQSHQSHQSQLSVFLITFIRLNWTSSSRTSSISIVIFIALW